MSIVHNLFVGIAIFGVTFSSNVLAEENSTLEITSLEPNVVTPAPNLVNNVPYNKAARNIIPGETARTLAPGKRVKNIVPRKTVRNIVPGETARNIVPGKTIRIVKKEKKQSRKRAKKQSQNRKRMIKKNLNSSRYASKRDHAELRPHESEE